MKYLTTIPHVQVVWLLLLSPCFLLFCRVPLLAAAMEKGPPPPHCPKKCGNVNISYPFGIGEGCSWRQTFALICNHSYNPPRPYYRDYEVIDITLETGEMRVVTTEVARICYNSSTTPDSSREEHQKLKFSPFLLSHEKNAFTGIGCHTVALLGGDEGSYLSGCITTCKSLDDAAGDGHTCKGRGCCQITTRSGLLDMVHIGWSRTLRNPAWNYSSCSSYAFVAENGWYHFHPSHLNSSEMAFSREFRSRRAPLVLSWDISSNDDDGSPCVSKHSERSPSATKAGGYLCKCSKGYAGNPYSNDTDGCKNIDECELGRSDPTTYSWPRHSKCIEIDGGYYWKCSMGRRKIGEECRPILSTATVALY